MDRLAGSRDRRADQAGDIRFLRGTLPLRLLHQGLQEVLDRGQLLLHLRLLIAQLLHLPAQRGDLLRLVLVRSAATAR